MERFQRHLLIDGYNVLHQWPAGKLFLNRSQMAAGRDFLARETRVLHDREGWRVTLVFDGKGSEVEVERPFMDPTFSLLYAPASLSADAVIEQLVAGCADPGSCVVVTLDRLERETLAAVGANTMTPEDLARWIAGAVQRMRGELQQRDRQIRREWGNRLDW